MRTRPRPSCAAAVRCGRPSGRPARRGRRLPKPNLLEQADDVLGAGGKLKALAQEVTEARYPKRVRSIAKLEADSVEMGVYSTHTIPALLQTEEYARGLFELRRPLLSVEEIERNLAARMARQEIIAASRTEPVMTFVLEEVTLRRCAHGRTVQRGQLEHLRQVAELRNVEVQIMPTGQEGHAGLSGGFRLFKLRAGATLGCCEIQHVIQSITESHRVQSLEMQYGMIRAQALTPRESLAFIDKVLGEV
ncbi:DUF5753 domain-containing protein [Streptomyces sp. GSL17-111]|uniref:DUF5753 domain-containing protein n=1 Tax=Streptomyces sp. GSL17-111 TaxID=3121596 RepID=UPI0030F4AFA5